MTSLSDPAAPHAATEKLYWHDAHASAFDAAHARVASHDGKPSLVLAATMFYPEGGGQLGDAGEIVFGDARVAIADTQVDAGGVIHHVLAGALPEAVAEALRAATAGKALTIRGIVDAERRRDHMVQHTAQHALSRALANAARAGTVSARLGATSCTIDIDKPGIADADLHRAEDLVNGVVMSDLTVTTSFPTAEELAALDLRKKPNAEKSANGVRVVTIEDFDVTPCGGTHCSRTGQIGQVRIVATEKYKGMIRITFHAGRRALVDARSRHEVLAALSADLTCGAQDVRGAVAKLRAESKALRERLEGARTELAALLAHAIIEALPEAIPERGYHIVPVFRPADDLAAVRTLAAQIASHGKALAIVGAEDPAGGELVVVVQRGGEAKSFDCGAFVGSQAKATGGRGGGRPERAEGRFPRGTSVETLAAAAHAG